MRVIIIDDEAPARSLLKHYIQRIGNIELLAECANGFEGVKAIQTLKPDLIFLDIQMPKLSGFEMLELLDPLPLVIFTTAYDEFALKAFDANAIDYLLKPFDEERFAIAVEKSKNRLKDSVHEQQIQKAAFETGPTSLEQIVVHNGNSIAVLTVDDLYMIEAQDDYVMIYTLDGQFLKKKTMVFYEKRLPDNFIRVHRSNIINTRMIDSIEVYGKQQYSIKLKNNLNVKTSKSGYKNIREKLSI